VVVVLFKQEIKPSGAALLLYLGKLFKSVRHALARRGTTFWECREISLRNHWRHIKISNDC